MLTPTIRRSLHRLRAPALALSLVSATLGACGGSAVSDSQGSGEDNGSGGTDPGSGGATGSGGGTASGGNPSTGGNAGGGAPQDFCSAPSDCVVVMDTSKPCYSASCSEPEVATVAEVEANPCLVLWENRSDPIPPGCFYERDIACPAVCALQPACVAADCVEGSCTLIVSYDEESCPLDE